MRDHDHHPDHCNIFILWEETFLLRVSPGSVSTSDSSPLDPPESYKRYHDFDGGDDNGDDAGR